MENITRIVKDRVDEIPVAEVFTYSAFGQAAVTNRQALAKALSRLVAQGDIAKLSRGKFYKPEKSEYGDLPLTEDEQLRGALRGGYISGAEAFNRLGISTQIPAEVVIATQRSTYRTKIGNIKIRYIKSSAAAVPEKIELVMILDALKQVKKIQDASPRRVINVVKNRIENLSPNDISILAKISLTYPPRTRALLGAIFENIGLLTQRDMLKDSLNPLTRYSIGTDDALPNLKKWGFR
jgi:hypothetical protein